MTSSKSGLTTGINRMGLSSIDSDRSANSCAIAVTALSWLVVGLSAVGGVILFLVFVVLPAASGPLARATPPALEQRLGESFEAQLTTAMRPCRNALRN